MIKRIVQWINRNYTHVRDKAGDFGIRTVLHILPGFLMGIDPIPGSPFVRLFIYYQKNEDFWTKDQAWKDVNGALIGYSIGRVCLYCAIGYIVWRVLEVL